MTTINIYCLVDPVTNLPFYVGATKQQVNIRLSQHINELRLFSVKYWSDKMKFINQIVETGKRPRIRLLMKVSIHEVDFYERFFYDLFTIQGFKLFQITTAFDYKIKQTNFRYLRKENQQVVLYSHYCCKNIFGNK